MSRTHSKFTKRRLVAAGLIPLVIAFGLFCKFYRGTDIQWLGNWINHWGPASVAYEWLFMLLAFLFFPKRKFIWRIAAGVFVVTCLIEFLQLVEADWLVAIRETVPGKLVLGNTFSWWDFPAYVVGCLLGVLILRLICRLAPTTRF